MKILYLLRHAKSSWSDLNLEDLDRPLTGRGRKAAKAMAAFLKREGMCPAVVLCSTAKRTRQTLKRIRPALDEGVEVRIDERLYLAGPAEILGLLGELEDSVPSAMVIGHNPGLEELALTLLGSGEAAAARDIKAKFPTGALAMLTSGAACWQDLEPGTLHLESFVKPKDLENA